MSRISNPRKLFIDNSIFGGDMILTAVQPYKVYQDGKPTNQIGGYKYSVVLPKLCYDQLDVKIEGERLFDLSDGESVAVVFDGLRVRPYVNGGTGRLDFTAQADNIRKADAKHG